MITQISIYFYFLEKDYYLEIVINSLISILFPFSLDLKRGEKTPKKQNIDTCPFLFKKKKMWGKKKECHFRNI